VEAGTEQTCRLNPPIKKLLAPGYVWRVFSEDVWVWASYVVAPDISHRFSLEPP
jgi:hypothetical protein